MAQRTVTIASSVGLHARPAALFVEAVNETGLDVEIGRPGDDAVDASSILGVMALGAKHGEEVVLTADGDGHRLSGHKRWATLSDAGGDLLVIATRGAGADGKPRLAAVAIPDDAPGVTLTASAAPFVPEIPHATVALVDVAVAAAAVLPGDGYAAYLKPFRTVEDLHVHAALCGYLVGVARRHRLGDDAIERGLALAAALATLAAGDVMAPATHRALAGAIALAADAVAQLEAAWAAVGGDEWQRWQRDRPLLGVARAARQARLDRARSAGDPGASEQV